MCLRNFLRRVAPILCQLLAWSAESYGWSGSGESLCRRAAAASAIATAAGAFSYIRLSPAMDITEREESSKSTDVIAFKSLAYGRQEYTNSIVASRDTNLSPAEAYDIIRQRIPLAADTNRGTRNARAADLGAGAGLSTSILSAEKGYQNIAAVDWSRAAWDASVTQELYVGQSVSFYEMDDMSFFSAFPAGKGNDESHFDAIVYNFAVNQEKAVWVAQHFLTPGGVLLAPCNDSTDYWYKQSYVLLDHMGATLWKSGASVGAWYVQFQPDVTSPNCTGIWCGNFNGFFEKQKQIRE
jgi:protein-L-isoaspartate O-methyltransferase